MRLQAFLLTLVFVAADAAAHPGHGAHPSETVEHYVFSPVHAIPVVAAVLLLAGIGAVIVASMKSRRPAHTIES